jgi:hypothetical protein
MDTLTPVPSPTPFKDAINALETSNSAGVVVKGDQQHGVEAGVFVSKDLGKGVSVEGQAGVSSKRGWGFQAMLRKIWR